MMRVRCSAVASLLIAGSLANLVSAQPAQPYPNRVIRILTSEAGGGSDLAARVVAQGLTSSLGQPVIVENRGGGVVAGEAVSKAPADGHTLLFYGNTLWLLPLLRKNIPYDTAKDFSPVAAVTSQFNVLVVHPSLPVTSVKDLISLARARPGQLNYGSGAAGGSNHLAAELFKSMARVNIVRVPFKSAGPSINALVAGEIQMMFTSASASRQHVKSGRLRALAISAARPSPLMPELPTVAAAALPGYETAQIAGMLSPAQTPRPIVDKLNHEVLRVLERPEVREKLASAGVDTIGGSPEQFAAMIKSEVTRMGKLITDAGIRDE